MASEVKHELSVWAQYFAIALVAEVVGFMGWLGEVTGDGSVFDLSMAFWQHELSRLRVWLPVFLTLSAIRFGMFYVGYRSKSRLG